MSIIPKIVIGTLVAGVLMFFLGWLIYGVVLETIMSENCNSCIARPMDQMIWWALIVSNFVWGLLLAQAISWTNQLTIANGFGVGAILGVLAGLAFDLNMYAMTTMVSSLTFIAIDVIAYGVMFGFTGAVTAFVMSKMKSK